jgi:hypothetical protein
LKGDQGIQGPAGPQYPSAPALPVLSEYLKVYPTTTATTLKDSTVREVVFAGLDQTTEPGNTVALKTKTGALTFTATDSSLTAPNSTALRLGAVPATQYHPLHNPASPLNQIDGSTQVKGYLKVVQGADWVSPYQYPSISFPISANNIFASNAVGQPGDIRISESYFFVCVRTNAWGRIPLQAFALKEGITEAEANARLVIAGPTPSAVSRAGGITRISLAGENFGPDATVRGYGVSGVVVMSPTEMVFSYDPAAAPAGDLVTLEVRDDLGFRENVSIGLIP